MTTNWKDTTPPEIGLYIASTERRADYARFWTGKHWTAPCHVADLNLPGRAPNAQGAPAETDGKRKVEWLEPLRHDGHGWIEWGGLDEAGPIRRNAAIEMRFRDSLASATSGRPDNLRWCHDGSPGDIVAYRYADEPAAPLLDGVQSAAPVPAPTAPAANEKQSNPKDMVGVRKAPMSTVSAAVLAEVGVAMLEGAAKYGRHNYRAVGVRSSVYYDATMRHLMDWWEGVDIDPESGMHHVTKAITSLVVLRDAMIQGMCEDDRAPRSEPFYLRLNALAGEILDKHADKAPRHYTIADTDHAA